MNDVLKVLGINSKGYGTFPKLVAKDRRLTIEAVGIYAYICSYAGSGNSAFPSVSTILYDLRIGETRFYTHLKLLIKYGYISIEKVRDEKGKFKHNVYILHTEILDSNEEKTPSPQNRGTGEKLDHPSPQNRGTGDQSMDNRGTNNNNLRINNLEEEEEEKYHKLYIEMALKVGATKSDLVTALEKMDAEPDIKNPVAWLQKALENEVINRELVKRPKNEKKPSSRRTLQSAKTKADIPMDTTIKKEKYGDFYL
ncbi:helix-turn-helix domain-containing protein [Desulfosporosinus sp.]|uniref:helix-turn-helix domain-containing protein n=1 Tax=Desulfosporosinus sp. TaxID=157907 RepID=UPI002326679D|nr:helix-turn-helix domain-containing protein [Desulfosporosinus sp.]MDA8223592.1 helix-turn-helix domain-containing protein [Desulfitobacterium hafniense]